MNFIWEKVKEIIKENKPFISIDDMNEKFIYKILLKNIEKYILIVVNV